MADNQRNGEREKANRTSSRRFICAVSATATIITVGTVSAGAASGAENSADPTEQAVLTDVSRRGDAGPTPLPNRIQIEGADDAEERSSYTLSVSGNLALDESHTAVGSGEPQWLAGDITDGYVSGELGNGADAFFYSGRLERLEIDGDAGIAVFREAHGLEE